MKHYLVVFDRSQGRLLRLEPCSDRGDAMAARFKAERLHRGNPNIEVVVLGAQSQEALRKTHSRYFGDIKQLAGRGASRLSRSREVSAL